MPVRSLSAVAAFVLLAGASLPAFAQAGPPNRGAERRDLSQMAVNRFFDRLDPERTGKISRAAYLADAKKTFDRIDIDKTGKLTKSELALWEERHRRGGHGGPGGRMRPWGMRQPMAGPGGVPQPRPSEAPTAHGPFADIPRDASGSITLDAYMAAAAKRFDAIDTAHSGTITVAVYRTYVKAEMAKRQAEMAKRRVEWGHRRPQPSPSP